MIKCLENDNAITQKIEIDLTKISKQARQDFATRIDKYQKYIKHIASCPEYEDIKCEDIFEYREAGNRFVYKTEVLILKVKDNRPNLLMVFGNPAIHSVAEGMFFSYEKVIGQEHRFWRALRECCLRHLPEGINEKRDYLLQVKYKGDFKMNIFLLTYFSFPTPAATKEKEYDGVPGIKKAVGEKIFAEMAKFEFNRFKDVILCHNIKNIICFQKTNVRKEILKNAQAEQIDDLPVYRLGGVFKDKDILLYTSKPTRDLYKTEAKCLLKDIMNEIQKRELIA